MKLKKALFLFALLLVLLIFSTQNAEAQSTNFSADRGYNWLVNSSVEGNYGDDIVTTAMAALALEDVGKLQADVAMDYIEEQEHSQHCWPKASCRVKDTAFALLALNEFLEDTDDTEEWLIDALTPAFTTGNWYLQVATQNSGTCKISYTRNDQEIEKSIEVEAGVFPDCGDDTWFDLDSCLESNLITNYPSIELDINCNELGGTAILSIIYKTANTYYIIKEAQTSRAKLRVNNGCFGIKAKESCNYEATLYANWALDKLESTANSLFWLEKNYDDMNILHNALLYSITEDEDYATALLHLQKNDGSWENNVYKTSFAIIALRQSDEYDEEVADAADWLRDKQHHSGSWNNNMLDTAIALYAAFRAEEVKLPTCTDGTKNGDEEGVDCGGSCPVECEEKPPVYPPVEVCNYDGFCDIDFNEDSGNCPDDCFCGDNICDDAESCEACPEDCGECPADVCGDGICGIDEDEMSCPEDCEMEVIPGERRGFPWWILILLIILGGIGYFVYVKFYKKPGKGKIFRFGRGKKPEEKPTYTPFTSRLKAAREKEKAPIKKPAYGITLPPSYPAKKPARKTKIEEELEKSIKEAKKLLKKGK